MNIQDLKLYYWCFNNQIKYVDSSGCFAISAGLIIFGMVVAFSAMVYIDYKDDGEVFNGSVTPQEYIGTTALGALLGLIAGLEFTITIPMLGFVNGWSAMCIGIDPETGEEATQKRAYEIYHKLTDKVKKMKWKKWLKGKGWMKTHFGK